MSEQRISEQRISEQRISEQSMPKPREYKGDPGWGAAKLIIGYLPFSVVATLYEFLWKGLYKTLRRKCTGEKDPLGEKFYYVRGGAFLGMLLGVGLATTLFTPKMFTHFLSSKIHPGDVPVDKISDLFNQPFNTHGFTKVNEIGDVFDPTNIWNAFLCILFMSACVIFFKMLGAGLGHQIWKNQKEYGKQEVSKQSSALFGFKYAFGAESKDIYAFMQWLANGIRDLSDILNKDNAQLSAFATGGNDTDGAGADYGGGGGSEAQSDLSSVKGENPGGRSIK